MTTEVHTLTSQLSTVQSSLSQSQSQVASAKAQIQLLESIQSRLEEENRRVGKERESLSDLITGVQRMHASAESSWESERGRYEREASRLNDELKELKDVREREGEKDRVSVLERDVKINELSGKLEKAVSTLFLGFTFWIVYCFSRLKNSTKLVLLYLWQNKLRSTPKSKRKTLKRSWASAEPPPHPHLMQQDLQTPPMNSLTFEPALPSLSAT
jgi:small-conductance mechanosensitive channel